MEGSIPSYVANMKSCKLCPIQILNTRKYCDSCRDTVFKKRRVRLVSKRRHEIKKLAIEYKGGKCQICEYDKCVEAFEFHHLEPAHKDFALSDKGYTRSWDSVKTELDKCVMLCANCHRETHAGLTKYSIKKL